MGRLPPSTCPPDLFSLLPCSCWPLCGAPRCSDSARCGWRGALKADAAGSGQKGCLLEPTSRPISRCGSWDLGECVHSCLVGLTSCVVVGLAADRGGGRRSVCRMDPHALETYKHEYSTFRVRLRAPTRLHNRDTAERRRGRSEDPRGRCALAARARPRLRAAMRPAGRWLEAPASALRSGFCIAEKDGPCQRNSVRIRACAFRPGYRGPSLAPASGWRRPLLRLRLH